MQYSKDSIKDSGKQDRELENVLIDDGNLPPRNSEMGFNNGT